MMAAALLSLCLRKNVVGTFNSELYSYLHTGEPKKIVKDFAQEIITTLKWATKESDKHQGGGSSHSIASNSHNTSQEQSSAKRDAKERICRENMMNNESKLIDMPSSGAWVHYSQRWQAEKALAAGGASAKEAIAVTTPGGTNGTNNKDGWLFDEVAGMLGPRSVAANLESLGGRSNWSGKACNSLGGKSHRVGKSHRSHRSKKNGGGGGRSHRRHRSRHTNWDNGTTIFESFDFYPTL